MSDINYLNELKGTITDKIKIINLSLNYDQIKSPSYHKFVVLC
jgi:hypothetical protein